MYGAHRHNRAHTGPKMKTDGGDRCKENHLPPVFVFVDICDEKYNKKSYHPIKLVLLILSN